MDANSTHEKGVGSLPTVVEAAAAIRTGALTSRGSSTGGHTGVQQDDTLAVYLDRYDEPARAAAAAADRESASGLDRGPLHGIPIGIEDLLTAARARRLRTVLPSVRGVRPVSDREILLAAPAAAGLEPSDDEVETLLNLAPAVRALAASLEAVDGDRAVVRRVSDASTNRTEPISANSPAGGASDVT